MGKFHAAYKYKRYTYRNIQPTVKAIESLEGIPCTIAGVFERNIDVPGKIVIKKK